MLKKKLQLPVSAPLALTAQVYGQLRGLVPAPRRAGDPGTSGPVPINYDPTPIPMKKIKKFCSLLPLLTLLNLSLFAQQRTEVSGQVFDREKGIPLPQATITVSRLHDTLRLSGASANASGAFLLKKVPQNDSLLVEIRYTGYESFFGVLYIGSANFHMQPV
ncbi:MAG: carboxypeptidase regulatory-like domain-containing protein [Mucilaginibacter sp.]|nr:carboxypeptidase regulatory-like domain-containing protein [Mucilaginibacter sp.]